MRITIAPNAFKGSLSAEDAATHIAAGLLASKLDCKLALFPVADGGDDTVPLLIKRISGEPVRASVHDPLGRIITADFGWMAKENKAFIALSDASGLRLLKTAERDPLRANTYGTGELVRAALDQGAEKLVIGVGGSATVDGASGLLYALGVRFLDEEGNEITDLPIGLLGLKAIDIMGLDPRLSSCEITVLCDVENKLLGVDGAAAVYGPQKGADEKAVILLEQCLERLAKVSFGLLNKQMDALAYGGAAGGAAAGLSVFTGAKLVSGIEYFLDTLHFNEVLQNTDLVITAEGSIDEQTLEGKGPFGVARRAKARNIPVIGLAGYVPETTGSKIRFYFDELLPINPVGVSLEEAMAGTALNLKRSALALGNRLAMEGTT
jgi:glycerate kinase